MKKIIPQLLILFFVYAPVKAQNKIISNYVLLRIESNYDKFNKRKYYNIDIEKSLDTSINIYQLQPFNDKKQIDPLLANGDYMGNLKEIYNYFLSPSDALSFLSKNGWTFKDMSTEIWSGTTNERGDSGLNPVSTVHSRIVYLLEKQK